MSDGADRRKGLGGDALAGVTAALIESLTAADVADVIVGRGVAALGADAGMVALVAEDGATVDVVAARGYGRDVRKWERLRLGDRLPVSDAIRENRLLFLADRAAWSARYPDRADHTSDGRFGASATVPLTAHGRTFGALHLSFRSARAFGGADQALAIELASRCALALERARLHDDTRRALEDKDATLTRLAAREREYAVLVDNAPDVLARYDRDLRILFINRTAARLSGIPVQEFVGSTLREMSARTGVPGDVAAQMETVVRDAFATGEPGSFDVKFALSPRASAPPRRAPWTCLEGSVMPEVAADGTVRSVVVLTRNVTERRLAEEALRESEERLRIALAAAGQRTWEIDLTSGRGRLSERFTPEGSPVPPPADVRGRPVDLPLSFTMDESLALVHPEDVAATRAALDAAIRGERPTYSATFRIILGGVEHWVSSVGTVQRDAGGHPLRAVGVVRDVTREMEILAERETLAAQQRRFVREMIYGLTEGTVRLCETEADLPVPLAPAAAEVILEPPTIRTLRKQAEAAAEDVAMPKGRAEDLELAVGEAAMNAVNHAGGGVGRVHADADRGAVQVWIRDTGAGIAADQIHRALERGWTTTGTFGHGFYLMMRMADRIYLLTGAGGTTVVLEQDREPARPTWL